MFYSHHPAHAPIVIPRMLLAREPATLCGLVRENTGSRAKSMRGMTMENACTGRQLGHA
jgi:hypothetical protein